MAAAHGAIAGYQAQLAGLRARTDAAVLVAQQHGTEVSLALAMGLHPRLGAGSTLRLAGADLLPAIVAAAVDPLDPALAAAMALLESARERTGRGGGQLACVLEVRPAAGRQTMYGNY